MTKRALLVGSSFSAAPLLFSLKRRGLHVTVCGALKDDPCHQHADESAFFDYSNKTDLLTYVQQQGFDYLIPSCNDFAYLSCNFVAHHVAFPGFDSQDTTLMLHTKHLFREFCAEHALPAPRSLFSGTRQMFSARADDFSYPVLVKPVDSFSGRGVTKVFEPNAISEALSAASRESRSGDAIVEDFCEGSLHSHSAFIEDGDIVWDCFADEFCTVYPFQVDCSHSPSDLTETIFEEMRGAIAKLVGAARLADGLLHTQFIASPDRDRFWIIECMRRGPGDLYGTMIERSTGMRYWDYYVGKFLGERYAIFDPPHVPRFIGRHTISVTKPMVAAGFETNLSGLSFAFIPLKHSAHLLEPAPYDKLGIAFIEYPSRSDMVDNVPLLSKAICVMPLEEDCETA